MPVFNTINDSSTGLFILDDTDITKVLSFDVSGITTATTRTWTADDRDIDFDAVPTSITTDSGTCTPASGSFSIVGSGATTSASGSTITITAAGGGISWSEITGTSQAAAVDTGYIANNAGLVTITLPDTAALGSVIEVVGKGAGKFKIAQNAGETIYFGSSSTTTGVGGSLTADIQYGALKMVCITADTDWVVASSSGNFTIV